LVADGKPSIGDEGCGEKKTACKRAQHWKSEGIGLGTQVASGMGQAEGEEGEGEASWPQSPTAHKKKAQKREFQQPAGKRKLDLGSPLGDLGGSKEPGRNSTSTFIRIRKGPHKVKG